MMHGMRAASATIILASSLCENSNSFSHVSICQAKTRIRMHKMREETFISSRLPVINDDKLTHVRMINQPPV